MQSAKKETNKATILLTVPMDQFIWVCDQVEYIRNLILKDMGAVKA